MSTKKNVLKYLQQRGLIAQTIYPEKLEKALMNESINFYIGFDPTADSLHVGHLLMLTIAKHLQAAGHKPFLILGGGTGHVGDPSGRTDMRKMMTKEIILQNCAKMQKQMERFISFKGKNAATFFNNADWLLDLKWIELLRLVGTQMSVNKMLATDAYKARWENGLSFLELNYMVMQAYDFLFLNQKHNVTLQLGGNDQWANIIAGVDLIRRIEQKEVFGMTVTLLTKTDGTKMGKTASGALWLDPNKTSPYDFYQYWININDADVFHFFKLLTDTPESELTKIKKLKGKQLIEAKHLLAFTLTSIVHGTKAAELAKKQALAAFSNDISNMPEKDLELATLDDLSVASLLVAIGFAKSKSEARRLITAGGITLNDTKVSDQLLNLDKNIIKAKSVVVHKGKKQHLKVNFI
ncbi:tyrosine--tRNA ligase [[Mycoplasma] testudinis]|uniref:tyrosine--tRNA ligase n=1 Tax=[Mycoplasma] testudinis TaxID=33924 RepID=UPI000487BDC4|nr:tyrosine--tRNA ligase [[Mycoplasma] testudinis]